MFAAQYETPGFGRALLSLIRSGGLGDQRDCYISLQAQCHPTLILRGSEDEVFPAVQLETLKHLIPRATVEVVPGLGHPMMLTHPKQVAPLITQYLTA
jgi:pimeloyl-ACP methyl ester carboxylesterase